MIDGLVLGRHAVVSLTVGGAGRAREVDFVLDTGFVGFLTLPIGDIASLGLPLVGIQKITLAGDVPRIVDAHRCTVEWDGRRRSAEVLAMDGDPLLGMSLLDGHDVRLEVTDGGPVSIEPL